MIIIGVLLNVVGLGVLCWALFALAIHALRFFVSIAAAIYTYQTGAGPLVAIIVAFVAGGFTLVLGQHVFSLARSPIVPLVIGLLFAVPAAHAGYDVTLALAHVAIPSEWWRQSFATLGAVAVGSTAWARVSILTEPALRPGVALGPAQPPIGVTTKGR
jgi:intracellular septation protein A